MVKRQTLSLFALFACMLAFAVIGLGAFTRLVDAGLGCPDWPGCYGHLVVPNMAESPLLFKAWAEMIHRYFAGGLGIFVLFIFILLFKKEFKKRSNTVCAIGLLMLIVYQILLGQLTVTLKLLPIVVTQHLIGGFLILALLWMIFLNNNQQKKMLFQKKWVIAGAFVGLILLLLQISLGAFTSTNYASLSCPDFPFCVNSQPYQMLYWKEAFNVFMPIGVNYEGGVLSQEIRQTIQMAHRLGALIFTIYMLIFTGFFVIRLRHYATLMKSLYIIWALICLQICFGIINVLFKLPLITAISHNLAAALLLLSLITLIYNLMVCRYERNIS